MTGIVRQHSVVGLDLPAQDAIQIARRVLATEGYQSVAIGPTAATFVRDVRPPLGIPLLAMLIHSQEQCTVTAETSRRGTALSLSGVVSPETLRDLDAALQRGGGGQQAPSPEADDGYSAFPTPGRGAPAQRPMTPATPARATGPTPYREALPGDSGSLLGPDSGSQFRQDPAAHVEDSGPLLGQEPAARAQDPDSPFRQDPAPRYGQDPAPRYGQDSAPSYGQDPARRYGKDPAPSRGQDPAPRYGQDPAPRYGQDAAPPLDEDPGPLLGGDPGPLLGQDPFPPRSSPLPPPPPRSPARVRPAVSDPLPTPLPGADVLKRPRRTSVPTEAEPDQTIVRPSPQVAEPTSWIEAEEPPGQRWVIILDDGRTIDVPDFALIGRDPEPAEDDPEAGLVSLIDPEMSVSKTHASFGVDDEGLWFLDRFSTNGTSMQAPGGDRIGLEPGIATEVLPGSEVWIGRRHLQVDIIDD